MNAPAAWRTNARGTWLYLGFLAVQCTGAVFIVVDGLPYYRLALHLPHLAAPAPGNFVLTFGTAIVMQIAYWISHRFGAVPCLPGVVLPAAVPVGRVLAFLGRLPFMFGSAVFALIFFVSPPDLALSASHLAVVLFALFALYCVSLELDRFGTAVASHSGGQDGPYASSPSASPTSQGQGTTTP